MDLRST